MWQVSAAERLGGREEQQDRTGIFGTEDGTEYLLVVADGLGGKEGGALASEIFVETARSLWASHSEKPMAATKLLENICSEAHRMIRKIGAEKGVSPRSTCVMLHVKENRAHWATVGDSRLYWFREGELEERSRDDSVPQMLVDMGKIAEDEMADHPDANRLTQTVGGKKRPDAHFGSTDLEKSDGFLLCTDGLWANLSPEDMAPAFKNSSLELAAQELVAIAADKGGKKGDNVSVALARFDPVYVHEEQLTDPAIATLNSLIAVCNDGCDAFREAADKVDDSRLPALFKEMADARARVREELKDEVIKLGGDPETGGTLTGAARLLFTKFRTALAKNDQIMILTELEAAEDRVKACFLDALKEKLPTEVQEAIKRQLDSVLTSNDLISAMMTASE